MLVSNIQVFTSFIIDKFRFRRHDCKTSRRTRSQASYHLRFFYVCSLFSRMRFFPKHDTAYCLPRLPGDGWCRVVFDEHGNFPGDQQACFHSVGFHYYGCCSSSCWCLWSRAGRDSHFERFLEVDLLAQVFYSHPLYT